MFNPIVDLEKQKTVFSGVYRGKVVNNSDPKGGLRIQVRVYPMMDGFLDADLPWAVPCYPLITGALEGGGWQVIPEVGSWVWVMFEEGDIRRPVYLGEAFNYTTKHSEMDSVKKKVMKFKSGVRIIIDDSIGRVSISVPEKYSLSITGDCNIEASGDVVIKGKTVSINP